MHLLNWYDASRRILPWREQPTPYRVWVSEIMLQQTRVEAVLPYYERFLSALPDVQALAQASQETLYKLWEGLGYYSRVRNLQKAAQMICEQYGGQLPGTSKELNRLPGIGPYTAGAIASIAFGEASPAVDGNVLRVISRVLAKDWDIQNAAVKKEVTKLVCGMIPQQRAGDFNQSLMELGAVVCLPNGTPKCEQCPLQTLCEAYRQGRQQELPVKAQKKARRIEERTVWLLFHGDRVAIRKRPEQGILAGMWEFPNALAEEDAEQVVGVPVRDIQESKRAKHVFTHVEWHMRGMTGVAEEAGDLRWVTVQQLRDEIALPSAFRVYRSLAIDLLSGAKN